MVQRSVIWWSGLMIRTGRGVCWRGPFFYDGGRQRDAVDLGEVAFQVARAWAARFNAKGQAGLVGWIRSEYSFTVSPTIKSWMLKAMGYAKLSARPRHKAQNERA
jgi:hypothetical protein